MGSWPATDVVQAIQEAEAVSEFQVVKLMEAVQI